MREFINSKMTEIKKPTFVKFIYCALLSQSMIQRKFQWKKEEEREEGMEKTKERKVKEEKRDLKVNSVGNLNWLDCTHQDRISTQMEFA